MWKSIRGLLAALAMAALLSMTAGLARAQEPATSSPVSSVVRQSLDDA
ncbi:MAG: hypothetical protein WBE20_16480 [Candidatus Acidiferrales bacterium]